MYGGNMWNYGRNTRALLFLPSSFPLPLCLPSYLDRALPWDPASNHGTKERGANARTGEGGERRNNTLLHSRQLERRRKDWRNIGGKGRASAPARPPDQLSSLNPFKGAKSCMTHFCAYVVEKVLQTVRGIIIALKRVQFNVIEGKIMHMSDHSPFWPRTT